MSRRSGAGIIRVLAVLGVVWVGAAYGQAPVEDRKAGGSSAVADGQQRLGFLRRELDAARDKVRQSEAALSEAKAREDEAKKQFEAARGRREAASKALDAGKRQAAAAQKAYDTEAAEFDKAVREGAKDARKSSTRK